MFAFRLGRGSHELNKLEGVVEEARQEVEGTSSWRYCLPPAIHGGCKQFCHIMSRQM